MLRINELLNPIGPEESGGNGDKIAHASSRVSNSWHRYQVLNIDQHRVPSITPTEQILLSTPGTQGPVNFPPFESVDEKTRQELTAFNIPQFGSIMKSYEHIPYNSSKKDFFAKTGRECIEGLDCLIHTMIVTDEKETSFQIYLSDSKESCRVHSHVGLQHRSC